MNNGQNGDSTREIQSKDAFETQENTAEENAEKAALKLVGAGFTQDGWFTIRIHESQGYLRILGYLVNAQDLIKTHFIQKGEDAKKKVLINPGKWNPFFKKRH